MSGLTDKEVASRLGLSQDTVKTYWKRIRQKVGAQSRPEIIAVLLERGSQELQDQNRKEIQRLTREMAGHQATGDKFRAIADGMPVGVYVTDEEDQGLFVNSAWLTLTGLSRNEALHRGWSAPIHPLDKRRAIEAWNLAKQTSALYTDQLRYTCPGDGGVGWLSIRASEIRIEGQSIGFVRTMVDVTQERQERERLLLISNEGFDLMIILKRDLFGSQDEGALRVDYLNERMARYLGADLEQVIRQDVEQVLKGESWREFRDLVLEVSKTGSPIERTIASPVPSQHAGSVPIRIASLPDGVAVAGRFAERVGS